MSIVGAFDVHRRQLTFDYLDTVTGEVKRGRVAPPKFQYFQRNPSEKARLINVLPKLNMSGPPASANA